MRKIIVGVIAMACVLSAFAAEEASKGSQRLSGGGQPLKFTVNQDAKTIEDAPGSDLMRTFQTAIGKMDAGYEVLREKNEKELQKLGLELEKMPQGSSERFGTEFYQMKLIREREALARQRKELLEREPFLQEILQLVLHPSSNLTCYAPNFCGVAPNFDFFKGKSFKEINNLDFSYSYGFGEECDVGEVFLKLKIDTPLPLNISNKLHRYFQPHGFECYKIQGIQKNIFKKGELIYRISTHTEDSLSLNQSLILRIIKLAKIDPLKETNTAAIEILKQDIDELTLKVEQVMIPQLEIPYLMGKIIMAFQEEAPRHREQGQSSSGQ